MIEYSIDARASRAKINNFPQKPYYSWGKSKPQRIAGQDIAVKFPYIQYNSPIYKGFMLFDIDNALEPFEWLDNTNKAIPPNWIIINKQNGHKLYVYELKNPVYFGKNAKIHPQKYYNSIYEHLADQFNADMAFNNSFSKNVLYNNSEWNIQHCCIIPYSLAELNQAVIYKKNRKADNIILNSRKTGRNVELFTDCRYYAYSAIRTVNYNIDLLYSLLVEHIQELNKRYKIPLDWKELKHIVKSICRWVSKHFSPELFKKRQQFANRKSRDVATSKAYSKYIEVIELLSNTKLSLREIAVKTGYSITSIYRWLARWNTGNKKPPP